MTRGKRMEFIFILALLISPSYGQKFSFGTCPTVTSTAGLTLDAIATTWMEYGRTPSIHIHSWQCATYTFTLVNSMVLYSLVVSAQNKITGQTITVRGSVTTGGSTGAMTTTATYLTFTVTSLFTSKTANYYIIAGVATTYLVLYACENVLFGKIESAIILTTSTATAANIQTALTSLYNVGYPRHAFRRGYQGCLN